MTEAILIKIAQRFRRLEDAVGKSDVLHAAQIEEKNQKLEKAEDAHKKHGNYNRYIRDCGDLEEECDDIQVVRNNLEAALEACREDMTAMQEKIRCLSRKAT